MNPFTEKASTGTALTEQAFTQFLSTIVLSTLFLSAPCAVAGSYDLKEHTPAVKAALEGRKARYDQLNDAQAQGWVGENNQGLAAQIGGSPEIEVLVSAENWDRMVIYRAIVEQNGLPPEALATIQQVFAETQRDRAQPGDPIQLPSGEWTRK